MEPVAQSREAAKCELAAEVLRSFGQMCLRVTGASMLPSVRPGDILFVCRRDAAEARPGDVVLFAREGRLYAHRVVQKVAGSGEPYWITRGDSLPQNDPPVSRAELLGRVTSIHRGNRRRATRLTFPGRIAACILRRSEFCTRLVLRLDALRVNPQPEAALWAS